MKNILDCKLGLYEKALPSYLSWEEKLIVVKSLGYDFLEISIDESEEKVDRLNWPQNQRSEMLKAMNKTGVRIWTMCLSANRKYTIGSEDSQKRLKGIELIKDAVRFSVEMGIRIIQLASYDEFYGERNEKTEQLFIEGLKEVTRFAAMHAVTLAFETMDTDFVNSVHKAMKYVEIANSPWLQVYPDIGNLTASGMTNDDIKRDILYGSGHIAAVHLKDAKMGEIRRVPYGQGIVDFKSFFKLLNAINYAGLFIAEMWTDDDPDYFSTLEQAQRFLKQLMQEATIHGGK